MEEIALEMEKYKISILALQEIRWKGEGIIDNRKYSLLYAGDEKEDRKEQRS